MGYNRNKNKTKQAQIADWQYKSTQSDESQSAVKYIGQQPQTVIDQWKAKHGNVYAIKTENKEIFYVRSPKIQEIEAYQPLLQQSKFITYNIGLFKTCYLGGAPIPDNEATLQSIAGQMMKTVEVVVSEVEKL